MTWHFTPHSHHPAAPVDNDEEPLLVVPNDRGGFSLRFRDSTSLIGHYSTITEAETYAKSQCKHVRVILPKRVPITPENFPRLAPLIEQKGLNLIRQY